MAEDKDFEERGYKRYPPFLPFTVTQAELSDVF